MQADTTCYKSCANYNYEIETEFSSVLYICPQCVLCSMVGFIANVFWVVWNK